MWDLSRGRVGWKGWWAAFLDLKELTVYWDLFGEFINIVIDDSSEISQR